VLAHVSRQLRALLIFNVRQIMFSALRGLSGTTKQVIRGICFLIPFYFWVAHFLSGFSRWPYAPLREVGGHFVDKRGHLFSLEEFAAFQKWESGIFIRFGIIAAFACAIVASWILGLPMWSRSSANNPSSAPLRKP
jgi:hypothetical protein